MTADKIRVFIKAVPFLPFHLHVADGRKIAVSGRDFILVSPQGYLVDVYQPNDSQDILDILFITGVSFDSPAQLTPAGQGSPGRS